MQMYLCGHRSLDFVSQDGKKIQGTQLSVSYPAEDVTGELVDRIFVRRGIELPTEMVPGDVLDISFNNKGKPERITIVKQGK